MGLFNNWNFGGGWNWGGGSGGGSSEPENEGPVLDEELIDQTAVGGEDFEFRIPSDAFSDPDGDDLDLTYAAEMADGGALPSWLTFDPDTHKFTGSPDDADAGVYMIRVTVADEDGAEVSDVFVITVEEHPTGNPGEDFFGSITGDTMFGTDGDDELRGLSGDDSIYGAKGNDKLFGFTGDDVLMGGEGDDEMVGDFGDDTYYGGDGEDTAVIYGRARDFDLTWDADNRLWILEDKRMFGTGTDTIGEFVEYIRFWDTTVELTPPNEAPEAEDVAADANEDGPTIVVTADFTDVDIPHGDSHTFDVDDTATAGTVTNNGDGTFTYDPAGAFEALAEGETATDTFTYTVIDQHGETDTATATITITGQNDAPVALALAADANEDGPAVTLTADFTDVDASDTHTFSVDDSATLGSVVDNGDGTFTYDPNGQFEHLEEGETATDTFTYTVDDGNGGTDTKTATVTITGQNDAPIVDDYDVTINENVIATGMRYGFTDPDQSGGHTIEIDLSEVGGTYSFALPGIFFWQVPAGVYDYLAEGETFNANIYTTVTDDYGASDTGVTTLTITGVNDAPEAEDIVGETDEDGPAITLTADFTDVDASDTHTFSVDDSATLGSVVDNGDGTFTYDPNGAFEHLAEGETATDTFTYTVDDGNGGTDTKTATVTITGQNDAPVAPALFNIVLGEGETITFDTGAYDVDNGDEAIVTYAAGPGTSPPGVFSYNGDSTLTFDTNGDFEYLAEGEVGYLAMSYRADDLNGEYTYSGGVLQIVGENDAPEAEDITGATDEGGPAITLTADFTDVDLIDTHSFSVDDSATLGSVVDNGDGTFTYDPNGAFDYLGEGDTATDTFTYTVDDGNGGTDTKTATVTITGTNATPLFQLDNRSFNFFENGLLEYGSGHYFDDPDVGDTHTITITPDEAGYLGTMTASLVAEPNGVDSGEYFAEFIGDSADFDYLAEGEVLVQTYTLTVTDQNGASDSHPFYVNITGENDAPTLDLYSLGGVSEDFAPQLINVLLSPFADDVDSDDDGSTLTYTILSQDASAGEAYIDGEWIRFDMMDAFDYLPEGVWEPINVEVQAEDAHGATVTDTITFNIVGSNDAAVIGGDTTGEVTEDGVTTVSGTLTETDVDNGESGFTAITGLSGTYGFINLNVNGDWTYFLDNANADVQALDDGETLTDVITVASADGTPQDITITINGMDEGETPNTSLTLNFNDVAIDSHWTSSPFTLNTTRPEIDSYHGFQNESSGSYYVPDATNVILSAGYASNYWAGEITTFTREDGTVFNFNSMQILGTSDVQSITLLGYLDGVLIESQTFTLNQSWQTIFPDFDGIDELVMDVNGSLTGTYNSNGTGWIYYDNMSFDVYTGSDPIILDLNGDGEFVTGTGVSFDLNADGDAETIGWMDAGDGMLVMDLDGSGSIEDGTEVLSETFNGFGFGSSLDALKSLDTNVDGVVDANDEAFEDLLVWGDANSDGVVDDGELLTMADLGITSISVDADPVAETEDGQLIVGRGVYTTVDGEGEFAEVEFQSVIPEGFAPVGEYGLVDGDPSNDAAVLEDDMLLG